MQFLPASFFPQSLYIFKSFVALGPSAKTRSMPFFLLRTTASSPDKFSLSTLKFPCSVASDSSAARMSWMFFIIHLRMKQMMSHGERVIFSTTAGEKSHSLNRVVMWSTRWTNLRLQRKTLSSSFHLDLDGGVFPVLPFSLSSSLRDSSFSSSS